MKNKNKFGIQFADQIRFVLDRTGHDKTGHDRTGQDRTGQDRTLKPQFCDLELPVVLLCHIKFNHQIVGFW
ncbi:unnamed protein product [Rhizophagus irregularis]|nr:unnamed protein product [Rhizophagus irregularis]